MKKALVCDDDKNTLFLMTFVLTGIGWETITSEDCKNIIEKVSEVQPSVIIMDNVIPDVGGIMTTQILKKHPMSKDIPVILCTSSSDINILATQAGADFYLYKPFDIKKLEVLMDEAYKIFKLNNPAQHSTDQTEIA